MSSKRRLKDVTLVIIAGVDLVRAYKAIFKSIESISFECVKIITPSRLAIRTREILVEKPFNSSLNSMKAYNHYCVYNLYKHIDTKFCLLIQQDGYIVNPELWRDDFLDYDYIGAPWPEVENSYIDPFGNRQRVGNGGFSLRSRKLLTTPLRQEIEFEVTSGNFFKHFNHDSYSEDGVICVHNRYKYERDGCVFAPMDIAAVFSKEIEIPENKGLKTFGFHRYKPN